MLSELQIEYIRRHLDAKYIIEYDFSYGFPCEHTRRVFEVLSGIPSWQKGLASSKLMDTAIHAWRPCLDLQLFIQLDDASQFNPFTHEIALPMVILGSRFEDLVKLIPYAYREKFPRINNNIASHVAVIKRGGIMPSTNRRWNDIFKKIPGFIMETYFEKKIKNPQR